MLVQFVLAGIVGLFLVREVRVCMYVNVVGKLYTQKKMPKIIIEKFIKRFLTTVKRLKKNTIKKFELI